MNKSLLIVLIILLAPITLICQAFFKKPLPDTAFMLEQYLLDYLLNTLIILFSTMFFCAIIGIFLAYFESFYEYSLRKVFRLLLVLPFAFPSYLYAYIYSNLLSPNSYPSAFLQRYFGVVLDIDIMNLLGCIFILSISFFPYLYILLRGFLARIAAEQIEAATSLGLNTWQIFFKLILPLSLPCIISGLLLIFMESLNAYGVPNYFGVDVLSTAIYKAWINYKDLNAAILLSAFALIFVFVTLIITRLIKQPSLSARTRKIVRKRLKKSHNIIIVTLFTLVVLITIILPLIHLIYWFVLSFPYIDFYNLFILSKNSFYISFLSSSLIVILSLFLSAKLRFSKQKIKIYYTSLITLGYSIPGSVIGISLLIIFINVDYILKPLYQAINIQETLYFSNGIFILIYAYILRFLALGFLGIDNAMKKLGNSFFLAATSLGKSPFIAFLKTDFILIKHSIISAFILVFIDIIKELPLASLLTGVSYSTLAFEMDRYASDEQLAKVAAPAIVIVLSCLFLLIIFDNLKGKNENIKIK